MIGMETGSIICFNFYYVLFAITFTYHAVQTWKRTFLTMGARKSTYQIFEMPGCACIAGYLRMTIHMALLIENPKDFSSYLCWCYCNIFSTQEHTVYVITHDEYDSVFYWKGESL